jgi:hypothetical protein
VSLLRSDKPNTQNKGLNLRTNYGRTEDKPKVRTNPSTIGDKPASPILAQCKASPGTVLREDQ